MVKEFFGVKVPDVALGVGRYVFGFLMVLSPVALAFARGADPTLVILGLLTPPLTLVIAPPMLFGFYFMFTGKSRLRFDVTFFIFSIICLVALNGFFAGMGAQATA
ncbi:MAG: hypothetical protein NT067_01370 [Candidatus Diapherotrites archaeon]|nr:hypothetical protein [Candidatus Diapherotrites archaeon]